MDLLSSAYDSDSDEKPDQQPDDRPDPLPKRSRPEPEYPSRPVTRQCFPNEAHIPGRYVSKKERAISGSGHKISEPDYRIPVTTASVVGNISDSDVPRHILSSLRSHTMGRTGPGQLPERLYVALSGHSKAVNVVQWSTDRPHLLASAGMDNTICIWNVWSNGQKKTRVFNHHNTAVKDLKWSHHGLSVLSCGYDKASRLIDIEKGSETKVFEEDQVVSVVKFHPNNSNLFLSGGSKGFIRLWDIRNGKVVHEYNRGLGQILDVEFTIDAKQFISSSDVSSSLVSENSIIVWDIARQVPLSNQVYVEAYTCPCIRHHPSDSYFVAQSNGNYIAIFSSKKPFKLDKYKRYEDHGVSGFPIKCNFSSDGETLVSGSSDGCIYIYNCKSATLIKKIKAYEQACIDVAVHPTMPNVMASCSWSGDVSVFE